MKGLFSICTTKRLWKAERAGMKSKVNSNVLPNVDRVLRLFYMFEMNESSLSGNSLAAEEFTLENFTIAQFLESVCQVAFEHREVY